jgi:hypothetical protein
MVDVLAIEMSPRANTQPTKGPHMMMPAAMLLNLFGTHLPQKAKPVPPVPACWPYKPKQ